LENSAESEIMEENWDLEAKARPEPAFNLQYSTSPQHRPKQSYLKYLKTVHVTTDVSRLFCSSKGLTRW